MSKTTAAFRKKYHKQLVRRSKEPGHPKIGQPGSTKRWASKLQSSKLRSRKQLTDVGSD